MRKDFWRKLQILGALALGTLPAVILLFGYACPTLLPLSPLYAAAFLVLGAAGVLTPGKWRFVWAIPVTLGLGALCFFLAPKGTWLPVMAGWLFYGILLLWSLQLGSWSREMEMAPLMSVFLLGVQLLGQLMLFGDSLKPQPVLSSSGFLLKASFLGFLLLTVLGMNRESMNNAAGEKRTVTKAMRRKNIWMTLGLFVLGIVASYIPYIYEWVRKAILWAVAGILWLLSRLLPNQGGGSPAGNGDSPGGFPPGEETEPSLFLQILEAIMMVLACIALLVIIFYVVRKLFRLAKKLLKKLWNVLARYGAAVNEDYIDEITDTRETGEESRSRRRFGKAKPKAPRDGTPEERVRYRYKLLLWKHPEWTRGTTAREKLPEEAADIYERARYSSHPVTEEEAEAFQNYKLQVTNYK